MGRELQGRHEAIHDAVDSTRSWEMAESTKYVMGGTLGEQQRLLAQAASSRGRKWSRRKRPIVARAPPAP